MCQQTLPWWKLFIGDYKVEIVYKQQRNFESERQLPALLAKVQWFQIYWWSSISPHTFWLKFFDLNFILYTLMLGIIIPAMPLQTHKLNNKASKPVQKKYTNCRGWWWFLYNVRYFAKAEKGFDREWAECESTIWKFPNKAVFRKIRKVSNEEKSRPILFCYCLFTEIGSVSNESTSQRSIQKVKD